MNTESKIKMLSKSDSIFSNNESIKEYDSELWSSMKNESLRQEEHIELIASENYASTRILEAQGSVLTNKYAEGYPSKRYYGGCEYVDIAEELAISRAKELFKADYANVQPHSGSSANAAAFLALLEPNDTILGMSLDHGGHLTHGAKVNFSGKNYKGIQYGLHPETNEIDYDQVRKLAHEHRPKLIIAGFSAYSGIIDWKIFREIADEVNAYFLVDMAHISGLVAAELYPSPIPFADVVTSTTHKVFRSARGGIILTNHEELAKKFMALLKERYLSPERVFIQGRALGLSDETLAQIIIFMQMRDGIRQVAPKLYRDDKHRQEVLQAFIEALEELEDELEEEEEEDE